jgi:PAS domain S-box-containing protein
MKSFFNRFISSHFFSERVLFLAVSNGLILDGFIGGVFGSWSTELAFRLTLSLFAFAALIFTFGSEARRPLIRKIAYAVIGCFILLSGYLCTIHNFGYDDTLTFLGAYTICSIYFRSLRGILVYLILGFLVAVAAIFLAESTMVIPSIFILRLFLAGILILGLSYATRQFQEQLQQHSKKVIAENKTLSETRSALEERLTHEHLLALVASRTNTMVIITNSEDLIEWVNPRFTEVTGYTSEEVLGKSPAMLRGSDTDEKTINRIAEKKASLQAFHETILNYCKDGSTIWVQIHVTPLLDDEGKVERYIAIQEDITEIKKTEQELSRNKDLLNIAQHQAKIGSWQWVDHTDYIEMSEELSRILGVPDKKTLGVNYILEQVHSKDAPVLRKSIENGLRRRSPFEIEFRAMIDGDLRNLYLTAQAVSVKNERTEILIGTIQDITERKRIEREMQLAEKQYRSLFEHSQHMICIHDLDGTLLSINPSGAHTVGYEPEEIIGKNIRRFFFQDKTGEYEEYMQKIRANGSVQGSLRLTVKGNLPTVWMYNNILISGHDGKPFVLSSNVDITQRVEMEKELRNAKRLAEEALAMKDRFVANISHELRTPMNAIVGFTELLIKTNLNSDQQEYTRAVHTASNNLTTMINDVLDLAKIEAGKIEFEARPFSVSTIISDTVRLLSQQASQKHVLLEWNCAENVPAYLLGDDLRLTQILINLAGNAIKFTEKGFVRIECSVHADELDAVLLKFDIEDSGIGIPPEKLEHIFEPFTQASAESNRKYGGTGLGLTIVQELTELQGGNVSVKSALRLGSCFTVLIPYKKIGTDVVHQVEQALIPSEKNGQKFRVLIVEDQLLNQQLAVKLVEDFGYTSEVASNGRIALEILRAKPEAFDVILMDLQMPELDGYEATRVIRQKIKINIPIIALTAHSSSGERERCTQLGMNDYLIKPFRAQELYFKITSVLNKGEEMKYPPEPILVGKPLKDLAGGDIRFETEMLSLMIKSIPEDYQNLDLQLAASEYEKARKTAHRLRSSVALSGHTHFAELLENFEREPQNGLLSAMKEQMNSLIGPLILDLKKDLTELTKKDS